MKLPGLALKNYQFVIIVIMLGTFLGISSLRTMPRSEDPNPSFPFFNIAAIYPGTSPEDMEELIADPLEEVLDQIDDITKIETAIEEGVVVISMEGEFGMDVEEKLDEIVREVKSVEPDLPDLFSLDVTKYEPNTRVKIQELAMGSPERSFAELVNWAEDLEREIEKVKGVDDVETLAYPDEIIKVTLDFQRLSAFNISLDQLLQILQTENLNIPAGDVAAGQRSFSIQSSGSFKSLDQIRETVIATTSDHLVHLGDVAEVKFDNAEDNWIAKYEGRRAILLTVTQKSGNNLVQVGENINSTIAAFQTKLPEDVFLETVFEQAPAVQGRINEFFGNLLQGVLLVGLVILIFLGFRPSVIIMTVIPLAIIMAIGMLDLSGYALQQISIAALVLALGLLVDNGIVVVENIQRYLQMGHSLKDAAIKGTGEVGWAVVSSTATTLLAFYPLALMESGPGEFLRTLPLTVIFALIVSLILALTLTPLMGGKLLRQKQAEKGSWFKRQLDLFIAKAYMPLLRASLKRGWLVVLIGFLSLVGAIMLFPSVGVSFFPNADKPMLLIEVDAPRGSSLDRTAKGVGYVESILDTTEFVSKYVSNTGHGNPMIYYNRPNERFKKYHGQILVNFESWDPVQFYPTLENFRLAFSQYPDCRITFAELKNGPPFEAPVEIRIIGDDLDVLRTLSFEVEEIIENTPGTLDIDNPLSVNKTDIKIAINRDKAGLAAVSLASIDRAARVGVDGLTIDEISMNNEEYDLRVQTGEAEANLSSLNKLYLSNQFGDQLPIRQVANVEFTPAISEILHFNTDRSTSVTANVKVAEQVTQITESIIEELEKMEFPEGYSYYVGGEYEGQQDSFGDLGTLLIIAMIGIFAVLVLQFRSFQQPMIVFAAVPLAITGSFVALFLTGWSFSFFAFVGFISLVGIVVNNSIILVDFANQQIRSGVEKLEAINIACQTRFTPILLTTTTTILGLAPLTFSSSGLWSPLGWTIIGGMISSTLLTLLVIPVLYKWFTNPIRVMAQG
ncbi:MAG: efflux RND transporter permease subunit [Cytophagales bacterium]|nr:efflux RND transporter permease subunit [Cytophagales bacterium]